MMKSYKYISLVFLVIFNITCVESAIAGRLKRETCMNDFECEHDETCFPVMIGQPEGNCLKCSEFQGQNISQKCEELEKSTKNQALHECVIRTDCLFDEWCYMYQHQCHKCSVLDGHPEVQEEECKDWLSSQSEGEDSDTEKSNNLRWIIGLTVGSLFIIVIAVTVVLYKNKKLRIRLQNFFKTAQNQDVKSVAYGLADTESPSDPNGIILIDVPDHAPTPDIGQNGSTRPLLSGHGEDYVNKMDSSEKTIVTTPEDNATTPANQNDDIGDNNGDKNHNESSDDPIVASPEDDKAARFAPGTSM
ncbi:uncharacterized protein LOC102807927 [Saccoglossus kowalevskii]